MFTNKKKSIKKSLGLAKYPQVLLVSPHSARGISHYQGLRIPKGARRFPISGRSQLLPALTGCWKLLPLSPLQPLNPPGSTICCQEGMEEFEICCLFNFRYMAIWVLCLKVFPLPTIPTKSLWLRFQYIIDTMSLIKSRYCGRIWLIREYGIHMKSWHLGLSHILTWSHILWHVAVRLRLLSSD